MIKKRRRTNSLGGGLIIGFVLEQTDESDDGNRVDLAVEHVLRGEHLGDGEVDDGILEGESEQLLSGFLFWRDTEEKKKKNHTMRKRRDVRKKKRKKELRDELLQCPCI